MHRQKCTPEYYLEPYLSQEYIARSTAKRELAARHADTYTLDMLAGWMTLAALLGAIIYTVIP